MSGWTRTAVGLAVSASLGACELREVTLTEPERTVVAEAYVRVGPRADSSASVTVLLHETLNSAGRSGPVPGARIRITRPADGLVVDVPELSALSFCLVTHPVDGAGTCYRAAGSQPGVRALAPGDRLALRVELAGGGTLTSETVVPGRFELLNVGDAGACSVAPFTGTGLLWSRSTGAWAYLSDTFINGLGDLPGTDEVPDPLYLWGLSVSAQDTAIVFPREFGVFARAEMEHELVSALQRGLPDGASGRIAIAAVDRNWINWARGGNFNPSGQVRVPSVRGAGTGVFGSGVVREVTVLAGFDDPRVPPCPPDVPSRTGG